MPIVKSRHNVRNDIQGLRALAVLAVIIFHTNHNWLPGGFVGVDIFFVISGFLISSIILHQKNNSTFSFKQFYQNRVKRIVPAYLFLLIIISLCVAVPFTTQDFGFFKDSLIKSLYFSSNQYFAGFGDYFAPNSYELPLLHTWSLAVEMQFYLLLPALIIFSPTRHLKVIISALIFTLTLYAIYLIHFNDSTTKAYFSLVTRIPEFLVGSFLALMPLVPKTSKLASNIYSFLGLCLIIGSLFLINESTPFPGVWALPPSIGAAMLIATPHSKINLLISKPSFVWIGGLSYSLYLWHWPVLAIIRYCTQDYELSLPLLLLFIVLTVSCSYISFRWVESRFRKTSSQKQVLNASTKRIGAFICICFLFFCSIKLNQLLIEPLPVAFTRYADAGQICHGKMLSDCSQGDKRSTTKVLFLGDSHAAQLNNFADTIGNINQLDFQVITASSCVTIPNFDLTRLPKWAQIPCAEQIDAASKLLVNTENIVLAGMWEYQTQSGPFMNALDSFFDETNRRNQNVIVLAQVPMLSSNVRRINRFEQLGIASIVLSNDDWVDANTKLSELSNKYPLVRYLDLSESPFFSNAPYYKGELIYFDKSHLNEIGSRLYGEVAAPYLSFDSPLNSAP